jgi:hypothetical protein
MEDQQMSFCFVLSLVAAGGFLAFWVWAGKAIWFACRTGWGRTAGMVMMAVGILLTGVSLGVVVMMIVMLVQGSD